MKIKSVFRFIFLSKDFNAFNIFIGLKKTMDLAWDAHTDHFDFPNSNHVTHYASKILTQKYIILKVKK